MHTSYIHAPLTSHTYMHLSLPSVNPDQCGRQSEAMRAQTVPRLQRLVLLAEVDGRCEDEELVQTQLQTPRGECDL